MQGPESREMSPVETKDEKIYGTCKFWEFWMKEWWSNE